MSLKAGEIQRANHAHTLRRHRERIEERAERRRREIAYREDLELDRQLFAFWLQTVPGYRELIRRRIDEASRRVSVNRARMEARIEAGDPAP